MTLDYSVTGLDGTMTTFSAALISFTIGGKPMLLSSRASWKVSVPTLALYLQGGRRSRYSVVKDVTHEKVLGVATGDWPGQWLSIYSYSF